MSLRTVPVGSGGGMILTGWSGLVAGQIPYPVDSTTLTSSANLKWGTAAGQGLFLGAGTATTDVNALSVTQTFNNAAVAFVHEKHVITDTLSAAGALALQYLGGAAGTTNLLSLSKGGSLTLGASNPSVIVGTGFALRDGGTVLDINDFTNGSTYVRINTSNGDITIKDGGVLGWTIGATSAGFSRISNGLIGVGTGAAGSVAGGLRAATYSMPNSGAAATTGNAVLVAGTVTVSTTAVQTADTVLLTRKTSGGTLGTAITYTISNNTSFTITSDSALDTSTFSWAIVKAH